MKNFKKLTMYDETLETTTSNSSTPGNILSSNEFYTGDNIIVVWPKKVKKYINNFPLITFWPS